jgi:hypothetical protein
MEVRFCDEFEGGIGWLAAEPAFMERCSHALAADGRAWLVDPIDGEGVEGRLRALGEPAGVVQTLDRHERDAAALAELLGVPRYVVPFEGVPESPFEVVAVARRRFWSEVALWWPGRRVLICGDALGTAFYFRAGDERLAVHPLLRLTPPRSLGRFAPEHVLVGHGEGIHGPEAAAALREALATARRRLPRQLASSTARWAARLTRR